MERIYSSCIHRIICPFSDRPFSCCKRSQYIPQKAGCCLFFRIYPDFCIPPAELYFYSISYSYFAYLSLCIYIRSFYDCHSRNVCRWNPLYPSEISDFCRTDHCRHRNDFWHDTALRKPEPSVFQLLCRTDNWNRSYYYKEKTTQNRCIAFCLPASSLYHLWVFLKNADDFFRSYRKCTMVPFLYCHNERGACGSDGQWPVSVPCWQKLFQNSYAWSKWISVTGIQFGFQLYFYQQCKRSRFSQKNGLHQRYHPGSLHCQSGYGFSPWCKIHLFQRTHYRLWTNPSGHSGRHQSLPQPLRTSSWLCRKQSGNSWGLWYKCIWKSDPPVQTPVRTGRRSLHQCRNPVSGYRWKFMDLLGT